MLKKMICFGVVFAMIFSFVGCNQGNELKKYKDTAKTIIESYAQEKGQENYTVENWTVIDGLVTAGKAEVDAAADKIGVDAAIDTTKAEIGKIVPKEIRMGAFYTLQESYDNGWLTAEDLDSIEYYRYTKYPEALNVIIERSIKETRANELRTRSKNPVLEATADDVRYLLYYGTYNDCVAVNIEDIYTVYLIINPPPIIIWKEN